MILKIKGDSVVCKHFECVTNQVNSAQDIYVQH